MEAAAWYEARQEGLARRFLAKWKNAEERMTSTPELNPTFLDNFRACRFEGFPYKLIYRIADSGDLQVIAVMHMKRRPGYWKERSGQ